MVQEANIMNKLIKYEFRKSLFPKLVILAATAVVEIVYLVGVFGEYENPTFAGILGLVFAAVAGLTYIGIESIVTLYRDLTTKQSYMLFMTPNSSYKILGAKALENGLSILLAGLFFGGLAYFDLDLLEKERSTFALIKEQLENMLQSIDSRLSFSTATFLILLFMLLCSLIGRIVIGYLAVVLTCTVLSGKKGAAFISLLVYIAISILIGFLMDKIPAMDSINSSLLIQSCIYLGISIVFYVITGWLMDKKLSV